MCLHILTAFSTRFDLFWVMPAFLSVFDLFFSSHPILTYINHTVLHSHVFPLGLLSRCRPFEIPDLLNEIVLLIAELLVFRAVCLKLTQEVHQLGLILEEDIQHRLCLIGVSHKHLRGYKKHVKSAVHTLVTDPDLFTFDKWGQNWDRRPVSCQVWKVIGVDRGKGRQAKCQIYCVTWNAVHINTYLKDMEGFKLDVAAVVSQHVHHQL